MSRATKVRNVFAQGDTWRALAAAQNDVEGWASQLREDR